MAKAPISRHPAFIPLIAIWLACLLAGCVAVLSPSDLAAATSRMPFPGSRFGFVATAAGIGAGLGWLAARVVRKLQTTRAKPQQVDADSADQVAFEPVVPPSVGEIEQSAEPPEEPAVTVEKPTHIEQIEAPVAAPAPTLPEPALADHDLAEDHARIEVPQHGKAVSLLRASGTQELAMPQLIERFAVALDDQRQLSKTHAHSYSAPSPPADMPQRLHALIEVSPV